MLLHDKARSHFSELNIALCRKGLVEQVEALRNMLLAALHCAYASTEQAERLQHRVAELEQTNRWQVAAIDELTADRNMLLTVIEDAACMPPLFTYCRRAPTACTRQP
jgi:hypothetical protein